MRMMMLLLLLLLLLLMRPVPRWCARCCRVHVHPRRVSPSVRVRRNHGSGNQRETGQGKHSAKERKGVCVCI